jgi:hypothetical protein
MRCHSYPAPGSDVFLFFFSNGWFLSGQQTKIEGLEQQQPSSSQKKKKKKKANVVHSLQLNMSAAK